MERAEFDIHVLEKILENFTKTTGLASVAVDTKGEPLSGEYGFCDYCRMIRATPEGLARCYASDVCGRGLYLCHAGLYDGGSQVVVNGRTLANIKYGQSMETPLSEEFVRRLAGEIGADGDALWAAAQRVRHTDAETRNSSVELLNTVMEAFANNTGARERQQKLFDTIPSGILEFFFDGQRLHVLAANRTLLDMIGYTADEFATVPDWNLGSVVHPEDYHLLVEARNSVTLGKGKTYDFRLFNKKTGVYRWISCDYTITEHSAAGVKVISAFLDIEDKRRDEDASAAKSRFLSRMSHEIRTPINAIMGIAELTRQDVAAGSVDAQAMARYADETTAAGDYLLTLVNDILDTSRIENNQLELHPHPVEVRRFMADLNALIEPMAREKGIEFIFERKTAMHEWYYGDGIRIKQIIINLINNAFKFTPRGGTVRLTCEAVAEAGDGTTLRFTVADNGIGMSKEFQEKLFTPFVQENGDTTSPFAGTGLGLTISKNLARLMKGDIVCHSVKGEGTAFEVTVVVGSCDAPADAPSEGAAPSDAPVDFGGVRLLVCEDHPLNQKITKALLERKNCTVEIAPDGEAGVTAFETNPPGTYAMILMDIRMPKLDGLAATRAIRALDRPDAKAIPIVAMSANAYEEDVHKSLAAGMNAHLAKPVDPALLYRTLSELLAKP